MGHFLFGYLIISGIIGAGYSWLVDRPIWTYALSMPIELAAAAFCLFCAWIILGRNGHKRFIFHACYLWFFVELIMTWSGKLLMWLGDTKVGPWLYHNRGWGIVIGLGIMVLGVAYNLATDKCRWPSDSTIDA